MERRGKGPCPLSQGRLPGPGPSEPRKEGRLKAQLQSFNGYLGLGMLRSEVSLLFATQGTF